MERLSQFNLKAVLTACKDRFLAVGFFSLLLNALIPMPSFYRLQVDDRLMANDLTGLRLHLTGNGILTFPDTPWLPICLAAVSRLAPWIGRPGVLGSLNGHRAHRSMQQ